MTNEELKEAILVVKEWTNACVNYPCEFPVNVHLDVVTSLDTLEYIQSALSELLQLKEGTHPDMVLVPKRINEKQMRMATVALKYHIRQNSDFEEILKSIYGEFIAAQKGNAK